MTAPEGVLEGPFGRMAVPAIPAWVRAMLPLGVIGAYVLLKGPKPFYVGRSDSCLAGRLVRHEYLAEASHVMWQICRDPVRAFHCEAFWYDRAGGTRCLRNRVHPARPAGHTGSCPFCEVDVGGLRAALSPHKNRPRL